MIDIYKKIDDLLMRRTIEIGGLINSDTTSRFYWTTCQAVCFHQITKTVEELLLIAGGETSEWSDAEKAMRVFLSRLDYGVQLTSNRGWSMRQLDIARNGGVIMSGDGETPEPIHNMERGNPNDQVLGIYTIIAFQDGIPEICSTRSNKDYSKSDWADIIATEDNIDRYGAESLSEKIDEAWSAGYWSIDDGYELRVFEDIIDHTPVLEAK